MNLGRLWLENNHLTGSIPPGLGELANLDWLSLSGNDLTGSIPPELGGLANLRGLLLGGNNLTGSIPAEIGGLANLRDLRGTGLTGCVPRALSDDPDLLVHTDGLPPCR